MKKKLALIILSVITAICCAVGLAACNTKNPDDGDNGGTEHTHTYAEDWSYDATYHWHAATCEHTDEVNGKAEHTFENGVCTVCSEIEKTPSEGLEYTLSDNEIYYIVSGIGACTDTDVVIPSTYNNLPVTSIGWYAFYDYSSLTSVTIPDSVTYIGEDAFWDCTSLTSVTIGNGITEIGKYAFWGCASLKSIVIPDSMTYIGYGAFLGCTSLTSVMIGNGVTYIGDSAFYNCTSLTDVTIPDSVTEIGYSAFSNCTSLKSVTIGNSVTSIDAHAFQYCYSLISVTIGKSVTSFGEYAFNGCKKLIEVYNLSSLNINKGSNNNGGVAEYAKTVYTADSGASKLTTTDDGYIFYDDTAYNNGYYFMGYMGTETALILPDNFNGSNYSIYQYAFYKCTSLESVTIPDKVTYIGYQAFYDCTSLTSVTIGGGVTSIGSSAFYNCYKLIEVYNLSSLEITAGSEDNGSVAYYAKNVYTADSGASKLTTTDDEYVFYDDTENDNGYYLMGYVGTETELILPDNFNGNNYSIYQYAFYDYSSLTSVNHKNRQRINLTKAAIQ